MVGLCHNAQRSTINNYNILFIEFGCQRRVPYIRYTMYMLQQIKINYE